VAVAPQPAGGPSDRVRRAFDKLNAALDSLSDEKKDAMLRTIYKLLRSECSEEETLLFAEQGMGDNQFVDFVVTNCR
jgi:hypothetical protein